ncbi:ATP-binding protein [Nonomuraea sp. NPDC046802]|uniref:ATP-binding protein n=1 Tax=Nonomuraea sp. NPDC046802 TaxID=3154919 RepID=UPI0033EF382B
MARTRQKERPVAMTDGDGIAALAVARERFFAGEPVESGVRKQVLASWQRCRNLSVPFEFSPIYHQDLDLDSMLVRAAVPVLDQLVSELSGIKIGVELCDEQARILQRRAGDAAVDRCLDNLPSLPGFGFPEEIAGTNGLGTALAERRPVFIRGAEHYLESMRMFACAGAPIRDPISGRIQGVLDLTSLERNADPAMLSLAMEAATRIEQRLLEQTCDRERALLRTFLDAQRRASGARAGPLPPHIGGPIGADGRIAPPLSASDRLRLLEKAAELISANHVGVAMALLSQGRAATLLSRPVEGPAGTRGIVVEAAMADGAPWLVASTADEGSAVPVARSAARARPRITAGTRKPSPALTDQDAAAPVTGGWLLAVSEPGIGRLALRARELLGLLCEAGARIGTTLDVTRTAEELTQVAVPRFAEYVAVDLADCVLRGDEPATLTAGLRRIALATVHEGAHLYPVGALIRSVPYTPQARSLAADQPVLEPALETTFGWMAQDPERGRRICAHGIHSLVAVPMRARGITLGVVSFYRSQRMSVFEEDDVLLAEELVGRAAVCVDNARRYTREHAISLELEHATTSLTHSLDRQRRFTTDASHELRTPLAGLRAQLEEARLHPGETDLAELIEHALGDVDRLHAIITDLLLLAGIQAAPASAMERIDLAELAAMETSCRVGDRHPTRLDHHAGVLVDVVPSQICRVLHNLLDNAQRHAVHQVVVSVRHAEGTAELTVTDDGPGVPEAEREHIFQRFTRLDTARSRDHGGTGLGLAIARDIVHAHHGTLHVEDVSPRGARFVLRLPHADP